MITIIDPQKKIKESRNKEKKKHIKGKAEKGRRYEESEGKNRKNGKSI